MNGITAETANTEQTAPAEEPKAAKKPRAAAHRANVELCLSSSANWPLIFPVFGLPDRANRDLLLGPRRRQSQRVFVSDYWI